MADTTIDLLKNSSYVGKMDELIAAVKSGGSATSDVEWNNVKNKPTTIGGYGITDAKIDNGTITLGNQTITPLTSAPVTSVNSKTGVVVLTANDVGALPNTTVIPDKTSQLTNDSGFITNSALTDYAKKTEIPTKTSELTNDSGYITAAQAPVQSVNNKTGAVSLTAADVSAIPSTLTGTAGQVLTKTADGQEWKDVEIPSGGGSSQWKIIRDLTITENTDRVDINTDDAGAAFSLHEIQVFAYTMSYEDTAESFTFLMNGYWGASDPYFSSGFKSPKSSDNYYAYNHFIAIMQDGIANVFQPWKQYIINSQRGGDQFSIGDKYQAIESVSFVGKFIAGCRFVLFGRVSS